MATAGKNGVTANTPKKIQFGAGTIHKGLLFSFALTTDTALVNDKTYYTRSGSEGAYVYTIVASPNVSDIATYYEGSWNFATSIVGATSGGSKIAITPEITDIDVDGALVPVKGLNKKKTGETATMEINFIELYTDILRAALLASTGASADAMYNLLESKSDIVTGDYWDNIAFVGKTLDGANIIVIMENALCTSGMELEGKDKEAGVITLTFECTAAADAADLDKLPWHVYYPTVTI